MLQESEERNLTIRSRLTDDLASETAAKNAALDDAARLEKERSATQGAAMQTNSQLDDTAALLEAERSKAQQITQLWTEQTTELEQIKETAANLEKEKASFQTYLDDMRKENQMLAAQSSEHGDAASGMKEMLDTTVAEKVTLRSAVIQAKEKAETAELAAQKAESKWSEIVDTLRQRDESLLKLQKEMTAAQAKLDTPCTQCKSYDIKIIQTENDRVRIQAQCDKAVVRL